MTLPIYTAKEIKEEPLQGGTTIPLLSVVENGNIYVLKLFGKKDAGQRCYTGAEAYSYYIATQFELNIPEAAFIIIPPELIALYKKTNQRLYELLLKKDYKRPCFASHYLGELPMFSPALAKKYIEVDEIETIYAFDALILNEDRKPVKPNILKTVENYCLIDHDKAFGSTDYALSELNKGRLCSYNKYHLFYDILKARAEKEGTDQLFETFRTYFNLLDLNGLNDIKAQLKDFGYETDECETWYNYLYEIRQNVNNFVNSVKNSLL